MYVCMYVCMEGWFDGWITYQDAGMVIKVCAMKSRLRFKSPVRQESNPGPQDQSH